MRSKSSHQPRRVPRTSTRKPVKLSDRDEITVVVRSKGSDDDWRKLVAESISGSPTQRRYLTRAEFGKAWGASREDLAAVRAFGKAHGLETVLSDAWRRCVVLSGTLRRLQDAFGVEFYGVEEPRGTFRTHRGKPQIPASISPIVEAILGLDTVPNVHPHLVPAADPGPSALNLGELRKVYSFPPQFTGKGQCVAVIELGGGLHRRDYNQYFKRVGIPAPRLRIRTIGDTSNQPAPRFAIERVLKMFNEGKFPPEHFTAMDERVLWTLESTMDLEIVGTLAPEATLVLVLGEENDQSEYHTITSVLADARNAPSVISCSWGDPESQQTPALMQVLDRWFQSAAVLGVTMCFSSGDAGDGTLYGGMTFTANFPASDPYVLACGGTTLDVAAGTEIAWKQSVEGGPVMAGGGGFSDVFELPPWQISAGINSADWIPPGAQSGTGSGLPDVSAKADATAAFSYWINRTAVPTCGTSSSTPLWAALIAVLNQALDHKVGSINPLLYEGGLNESLRDITQGNIGHLQAAIGWDPASGWGSPHGEAMLEALSGGK